MQKSSPLAAIYTAADRAAELEGRFGQKGFSVCCRDPSHSRLRSVRQAAALEQYAAALVAGSGVETVFHGKGEHTTCCSYQHRQLLQHS
ncbi:hypothetical protein WJX73_007159 [Symbiochloris irregularis]|uniref:Uncharacterized protein n=1 Tax=Symbiochloris irregularis TaxID=706552 RepID=A0AAW1NVV3_9CHLO